MPSVALLLRLAQRRQEHGAGWTFPLDAFERRLVSYRGLVRHVAALERSFASLLRGLR